MKALNLFIPITKVDEPKRLVYGIATAEQPDQSGEICDYETTVPYYKEWSARIEKASDGKSKGNLRSMHSSIAAGKITQISFNDEAKQIEICGKVVDDAEWKKVIEGVYTGFSQGGSYVKTWKDGEYTKYTAKPAEVSLVDNPCLDSATFTLLRAGGTTEMRKFQTKEEPMSKKAKLAQVWQADDGSTYATKAEALKKNAEIEAAVVSAPGDDALAAMEQILNKREGLEDAEKSKTTLDGNGNIEKREFSDEERKKAADEGEALPDGSFPIKTKEDLENAVHAYGRAKDKAKAKAHIIARAKALDAEASLPAGWDGSEKAANITKLKKLGEMGNECWDAQCALEALISIQFLCQHEMFEASSGEDEDGSQVEDLMMVIDRLKSFIASEIKEKTGEGMEDGIEKRGAKISAASKEHIEKMHKSASDHMDMMNKCYKALGMDGEDGADGKDGESVQKSILVVELEKQELIKAKEEADVRNSALKEQIDKQNDILTKFADRLKRVENQPLPTKGALYAVDKAHEQRPDSGLGDNAVESKPFKSRTRSISPEEARRRMYGN